MESSMAPGLSPSICKTLEKPSITPFLSSFKSPIFLKLNLKLTNKNYIILTSFTANKSRTCAASATDSSFSVTAPYLNQNQTKIQRNWIVVVKAPPVQRPVSRPDVIDYYVKIMDKVLGSEKDAQGCIYNASFDARFGFCCDIDEQTSKQLACLPEVLSINPDPDFDSVQKDYSDNVFPAASFKNWLVRVEMPESSIITRAQFVDYCTRILTNVLGTEKDAQMCMYHVSSQSDYGFCCELDDERAKELAGVPGVISVISDDNVDSDYKDYRGRDSSITNQPANIKTKKLFVTGLSFYTSEKTLRAAFEGFGELVEVKIIMDKISKRSKGFAFIEYTTEEAANEALREMNGKIINGWMIVVDVAKTNPPKYNRAHSRPAS